MIIKAEKLRDARDDKICEFISRSYRGQEGVTMVEHLSRSSIADFSDDSFERISEDNGKTWGEWKNVYKESGYEQHGIHDRNFPKNPGEKWNPVHKHWVGSGMERIFREGHEKALSMTWKLKSDEMPYLSDHCYIRVREEGKEPFYQLMRYEEGAEFDPNDPVNPDYFLKNTAFPGCNWLINDKGDLLIPVGVRVDKCCAMAGKDVNEIFPSNPTKLRALIVMHGVWNGEKYDFLPSRPVIISDLQSSRGMDEPTIAQLKSGRIVVVFRGAYYMNSAWNTRIEPGTPGFKWYTWSDDGGKTFTEAMPWHFDDGEVIYSSASISHFFRDARNDRLYWIGNITGHQVYENNPRYPLCIVEVDETYGTAKKESFTIIDTRREGEGERMELSNFSMMQNRVTGNLEIFLTKRNQFPGGGLHKAEPWHYEIVLPE